MNLSTGEVCLSSNHLQGLDPSIVGTKHSTHESFWDPSYTNHQPAHTPHPGLMSTAGPQKDGTGRIACVLLRVSSGVMTSG